MPLKKIKNRTPVAVDPTPQYTFDGLANTVLAQRWKPDGSLDVRAILKPYDQANNKIDFDGVSGQADKQVSLPNAWETMQEVPALAELAACQVAVLDMFVEKGDIEAELSVANHNHTTQQQKLETLQSNLTKEQATLEALEAEEEPNQVAVDAAKVVIADINNQIAVQQTAVDATESALSAIQAEYDTHMAKMAGASLASLLQ